MMEVCSSIQMHLARSEFNMSPNHNSTCKVGGMSHVIRIDLKNEQNCVKKKGCLVVC